MNEGPLRSAVEIAFAGGSPKRESFASARQPGPDTQEIGFTGLRRTGGLICEEYLSDLSGAARIDAYAKMRSDGMVAAVLNAMRLPIIAASWVVEPAGTDANALKAAELVERNLFGRIGECWESEVRKALSCIIYGFAVEAKQWAIEKGEAVLSELRPVHPRAILQGGKNWDFDAAGHLRGLWEYGTDGVKFREDYLPSERFVLFGHDAEWDNPEGRGVLRDAYKHYKIKDRLYKLQAVGLERGAVGTPIATYEAGTPPAVQNQVKTFLRDLAVNENGYGLFPAKGITFSNASVEVKTADLAPAIAHHDTKIAQSALAGFLTLGQEGKGGAYALSADQTDLFLLALAALADYIAAIFNRKVIPELVAYNIATDQFPRLSATIARKSAAALAALIRPLMAGTSPPVTWSEADEDWLREAMELPERTAPRPEPQPPSAPAVPKSDLPAEPKQQSRERIELGMFALDPAQFREAPAYPELGQVIDQFYAGITAPLEELQADLWRIGGLPDVDQTVTAGARTFRATLTALSEAQQSELQGATTRFLDNFFGEDRTRDGFIGTTSEDALLQGYERLAHATGVQRGAREQGAQLAAFRPTRESPEIKRLLGDAFDRLSTDGRLRLEGKLDEIRQALVDGALNGRNSMETAKDLTRRFGDLDFDRLARTESAFASTQGFLDEGKAAKAAQNVSPVISALACAICQSHAGEVIPLDEAVPGENMPPYHPHCLDGVKFVFD